LGRSGDPKLRGADRANTPTRHQCAVWPRYYLFGIYIVKTPLPMSPDASTSGSLRLPGAHGFEAGCCRRCVTTKLGSTADAQRQADRGSGPAPQDVGVRAQGSLVERTAVAAFDGRCHRPQVWRMSVPGATVA